jgi:uncharacterized membrane protein YeaQ/YmgE (transglycosylase-associated protein family)
MEAQGELALMLFAGLLGSGLFSLLLSRGSYGFLGNALLGIFGAFIESRMSWLNQWAFFLEIEEKYLNTIRPAGDIWEGLWPGFFAGAAFFLIFGVLKAIFYRPNTVYED